MNEWTTCSWFYFSQFVWYFILFAKLFLHIFQVSEPSDNSQKYGKCMRPPGTSFGIQLLQSTCNSKKTTFPTTCYKALKKATQFDLLVALANETYTIYNAWNWKWPTGLWFSREFDQDISLFIFLPYNVEVEKEFCSWHILSDWRIPPAADHSWSGQQLHDSVPKLKPLDGAKAI